MALLQNLVEKWRRNPSRVTFCLFGFSFRHSARFSARRRKNFSAKVEVLFWNRRGGKMGFSRSIVKRKQW